MSAIGGDSITTIATVESTVGTNTSSAMEATEHIIVNILAEPSLDESSEQSQHLKPGSPVGMVKKFELHRQNARNTRATVVILEERESDDTSIETSVETSYNTSDTTRMNTVISRDRL